MSKKKNREPMDAIERLKRETWQALLAVACFIVAVFFLLAPLGYAGPVGKLTYQSLGALLGIGFFLIPIVLILLGIAFARSLKPNFFWGRLVAGLIFFLAALGLISLGNHGRGGLVGDWSIKPLVRLFDVYLTAISLAAAALGAMMVMFDFNIFMVIINWWRRLKTADSKPLPEPALIDSMADAEIILPSGPENKPVKTLPDEATSIGLDHLWSGPRQPAGSYKPPPLSLLGEDSGRPGAGDIKANANIIKRTLANFGINVEMDEVSIGPSITRYALKPAEGVKLSRIVALQNDLSLALAAHPLRIEAPIPGKSLVGIEIPNTTKTTVGLASLIGTKEFTDSPAPLLVTLGRGISGAPYFSNLAKAPHFLIAGTTGSGKSVVIHAFITSLLFRNSPDQLRFIMIDPKRVELTLYRQIPHLLTPVITDPKKAIMSLKWTAKEMERRYDILEREAVRDIQSYHKNVNNPDEPLPYIVIVIDELADIMSTYPRELEAAIIRLAQMSRAVGIHLVLSTQRPSVEVITGLIKANIPTRVALQVASQIDSRTILDLAGAEKLLGAGDLLYLGSEMSKPVRLQSAFVSEQEVKGVVSYLTKAYAETPPADLNLETEEPSAALDNTSTEDDDPLYEEARQEVITTGKASASYLQRKFKVGYARAARLLDLLEAHGVIGPGEGAKPREVYGSAAVNDHDQKFTA